MRRILISKRDEFSYTNKKPNSMGFAIKQLGTFFEEVDRREKSIKEVTVSNNTLPPKIQKS